MLIRGKCHCGNLSFGLLWEPDPEEIPARECRCSFCVKHGGLWTSHARGSLEVAVADPSQWSRYAFGTHTADFHVCARCGVTPVVTSLIEGRLYAVVSVNAIDNAADIRVSRRPADFEGESEAARLARRKLNWIAQVEFTGI